MVEPDEPQKKKMKEDQSSDDEIHTTGELAALAKEKE